MKKNIKSLCSFLLLILFVACAAGEYKKESYETQPMMAAMEEAPSAAFMSMDDDELSRSSDKMDSSSDQTLSNKNSQGNASSENQQRMRIYNGNARLIVEDPRETRIKVEERVKEWGGYLESSYGETLVLRVPAQGFYEYFDELLSYGEVADERIETWDVSEQYLDLQSRKVLAEDTRNRLYRLLERTEDPQERSNILREIGRLTEEIEQIRLNMESLENRASFSRITLILQARLQQASISKEAIPFSWIAGLNPLYPSGDKFRAELEIDLGSSFAVFDDSEYYLAENPQGVLIRGSSLENHPEGDSLFWQKALIYHLKDYYQSSREVSLDIGEDSLPAVEFISKDRNPYRYVVGVQSDGNKLHLLEFFYPDPDWDDQIILDALKLGRIK